MKIKMERLVPAGIDYKRELNWLRGGLIAAFIYSLGFFIRFMDRYGSLFRVLVGNKRVLNENAVMPDYVDVLGDAILLFLVLALVMVALMVYHYIYHFQGSKSIYLMRRLPDRWELWRRCLTLPVMGALTSLLAAAVIIIIYYGIYMLATPRACLSPGQWHKIWNVF
jgi:hypothetical protein